MSAAARVETTENVRELADVMRGRIEELAAEALETLKDRLPDYLRQLGFEGDDPLDVSRAELDTIARVLASTGAPLPRQLTRSAVDLGRRRAQQGLTLEHLLEAEAIHREIVVRHLEDATGPQGEETLMLAEHRIDAYRDAVILALTRGYLAGHVEGYEQEHRELAALMSIMRAVSRSLEAGDIAEAAVEETCNAMRLDYGVVWLTPRERPDSLVLLRTYGLPAEQQGALGQEMPIYGLLEEALVSDMPLDGRVDLPGGLAGSQGSVLGVALRGRADTVGLMVLGSHSDRDYGAHDLAFVALVAEHVGMALANAEQLLREARTDHLTQLANRPEFDRAGLRTVAAARRYGRPFTVMLLDLDNLKLFNDRHGHQFGDAAIQAVAHALRSTVRATDVCARLGGDEFGVVMPEAGPEEASEVAERVRKTLQEASADAELPKPAEVSIGFATWDPKLDWRQLLRMADERLYDDKRLRRVRSVRPTA